MGRFAKKLADLSDEMSEKVERIHRAVALVIINDLIFNTPVDTGRARSNWQANMRKPKNNVIEAHAPGKKLGINETANTGKAISLANQEIGKHTRGEDIWITNNVKYIGFLNDGNSLQSPKMFVERAIKRGESIATDINL